MVKFGLLGKNIDYSLSPKLHELFFEFAAIDGEYTLFDGKNSDSDENFIKEILKKIRLEEIQGINVTIPYKERIMRYLDEIDPAAAEIGAVNTVCLEYGKLKGYNTDYRGIIESIKKMKVDILGEKVYILGSGGSSKAAAKAIIELGGIPVVVSREVKKLNLGTERENEIIDYNQLKNIKSGKLLINSTPLGNGNNLGISPLEEREVKKFENTFDLNYNPLVTEIMRYSNKSENGLYMLIVQGICSEVIWNRDKVESGDLNFKECVEKIYEKLKRELENDG